MSVQDPHADSLVARAGASLEAADGVVILLHGRGGSAEDILALGGAIRPELHGRRLAWLAPEARGNTWYPNSFLAPRAMNEPGLSSALGRIASLVAEAEAAGITKDRIVIGGFSQGACLSTEFVASHPAGYGGLMAFTGGLIGPPGMALNQAGDLGGMPALVLSGVPDPHVPWERVEESAEVLSRMGAKVTLRPYPGRAHTVSQDEVRLAKALLEQVFGTIERRS